MGRLIWLLHFLFYLVQYQVIASSSSLASFSTRHFCTPDERTALLQFKPMFIVRGSASSWCGYWGHPSYPKTVSWNDSTTNCCSWDGVMCGGLEGHVIGLDLSCSQLYGTIYPNSSLFQLSHLQKLNLAYNNFKYSSISSAFGQFVSLTHLNLSRSNFSGPIPSEIFHLSKLVSLDLSYMPNLKLEIVNFKMMLRNQSQLQELVLFRVNISSVLPDSLMNMSSLTFLDLGWTGLHGKLPDNIFQLLNLQRLRLSFNDGLTGNLPRVNWSSSSSLKELDISYTSLSGELPESIGYLKSLQYLGLASCYFSGSIPKSLGNLTQITNIRLFINNFNSQIPSTLSNLKQLTHLFLFNNALTGPIFSNISGLRNLHSLYLFNNWLSGTIPSGLFILPSLSNLDLSSNQLTGPIPSNTIGLQNLQTLYLFNNSLNGTIPSWLFTLPSLVFLRLSSNRLTGQLHDFLPKSALVGVGLSDNELHGPIPQSISNLVDLTYLYLSSNNLSGVVELHIFSNLRKLETLDLSYNRLLVSTRSNISTTLPKLKSLQMASCKIEGFPDFLKTLVNLEVLDLSNNQIHGQIPEWVGLIGKDTMLYLNLSHNFLTSVKQLPWKKLKTLDLHSNFLQGPLPNPQVSTSYFFISYNNLTGEIPLSICNAYSIKILDLSHNKFSGPIPQCLGYFSKYLSVLDLRSNGFQGTITLTFSKSNQLRNLDLNDNQFEGPVPRSLSNCRQLEVIDLGNNKINDTFPNWLGTLPELQVIVLRSNRFHGPIDTSKPNHPFPKLRIVDISHNEFNGHLPGRYFENFQVMKNITMPNEKYMGTEYYRDSVAVTMKGVDIELVSILIVFTTIDLSSNKFSGEIPNVIGKLESLIVLNLSHNWLTGHIPTPLGDLRSLESLDLSSNKLVGKIPNQLASLTFLEVLNLSRNHLNGPIPGGNQFDTFENNSYAGNSGLCGFPLSKKCEDNELPVQPTTMFQQVDYSDFASGFTWEVVLLGYGCGMCLGLVMGSVMFLTGRPKWFTRIVERKQLRKVKGIKQIGYRGLR